MFDTRHTNNYLSSYPERAHQLSTCNCFSSPPTLFCQIHAQRGRTTSHPVLLQANIHNQNSNSTSLTTNTTNIRRIRQDTSTSTSWLKPTPSFAPQKSITAAPRPLTTTRNTRCFPHTTPQRTIAKVKEPGQTPHTHRNTTRRWEKSSYLHRMLASLPKATSWICPPA